MSATDFKITVLITFYNSEKYVSDSLGSVFSQKTDFPFKVIVGDDGSTDGTIDRVKEWEEKYPSQISHLVQEREPGKKYMGGSRASKNRLALLKMVDTPYFIFLDGDDFWTDENKLQSEFDILENPSNSDCEICAHQVDVFYEENPDKKEYYPESGISERKFDIKTYIAKQYIHTDSMLFRSSHIKDLPYDCLGDFFNDSIITFCFLQFGSLYYLPKCMASYRKNGAGIWAGEKKAVSIVRQIMGYEIECKIAPEYKDSLTRRNYGNFVAALKCVDEASDEENGQKRNNILNIPDTYLSVAEKYGCTLTINLLKNGHLFSDTSAEDKKILKKIYFDKQLNRLIYHFK